MFDLGMTAVKNAQSSGLGADVASLSSLFPVISLLSWSNKGLKFTNNIEI